MDCRKSYMTRTPRSDRSRHNSRSRSRGRSRGRSRSRSWSRSHGSKNSSSDAGNNSESFKSYKLATGNSSTCVHGHRYGHSSALLIFQLDLFHILYVLYWRTGFMIETQFVAWVLLKKTIFSMVHSAPLDGLFVIKIPLTNWRKGVVLLVQNMVSNIQFTLKILMACFHWIDVLNICYVHDLRMYNT